MHKTYSSVKNAHGYAFKYGISIYAKEQACTETQANRSEQTRVGERGVKVKMLSASPRADGDEGLR